MIADTDTSSKVTRASKLEIPCNDSKQDDVATAPSMQKESANLHDKDLSEQTKRPKLKSYKSDILQSQWETMFSHLLNYKVSHGNCLVPHRYNESSALGAWVSTQRRQYKVWKEGRAWTGKANSTPMDPSRGARLEEIGFVWSTNNPLKIPWERRYQELVAFKGKHGHCLVPSIYKSNKRLGHWVSTQRHDAKVMIRGRPSRMTTERYQALNEIGFIWTAPKGGNIRNTKKSSSEDRSDSDSLDDCIDRRGSGTVPPPRQNVTARIQSNNRIGGSANGTSELSAPMVRETSEFPWQADRRLLFPTSESVAAAISLGLAGPARGNFTYPSDGYFSVIHPNILAARQMMMGNSFTQALAAGSFGHAAEIFGSLYCEGDRALLNARLALVRESQVLGSSAPHAPSAPSPFRYLP